MECALAAARAAGDVIARDFGAHPDTVRKGRIDLVTKTDLEAERRAVSVIRAAFPSHDILAEEKERSARRSEFLWLVDPLDGTTNFAHTYPVVAVSVALLRGGELLVGVVHDPLRAETFAAEAAAGARLNGGRLEVSRVSSIGDSLVCTGFPYSIREDPGDNLATFSAFCLSAQGVRRDGAAALDLCYVAAGRFDGFWERKLRPWDTAAGELIVREAGGVVTDYSGNSHTPFLDEIIASNGRIHEAMLRIISAAGA